MRHTTPSLSVFTEKMPFTASNVHGGKERESPLALPFRCSDSLEYFKEAIMRSLVYWIGGWRIAMMVNEGQREVVEGAHTPLQTALPTHLPFVATCAEAETRPGHSGGQRTASAIVGGGVSSFWSNSLRLRSSTLRERNGDGNFFPVFHCPAPL